MHLEGSSRGQAPATQGPQRHGRDESATASAGPVNAARLSAHEKKGAAPAVLGLLNDRQAADLLGVGERTFLDMIASAEWLPVPIAAASVSSMVGPMLPAMATRSPARSTSMAVSEVVVVLPLVPVIASTLGA